METVKTMCQRIVQSADIDYAVHIASFRSQKLYMYSRLSDLVKNEEILVSLIRLRSLKQCVVPFTSLR